MAKQEKKIDEVEESELKQTIIKLLILNEMVMMELN